VILGRSRHDEFGLRQATELFKSVRPVPGQHGISFGSVLLQEQIEAFEARPRVGRTRQQALQ
jgi:hypothetical protein